MRLVPAAVVGAALLAVAPVATFAQTVVYQSSLQTGTGWTVNQSAANSDAVFGFDYADLGIPQPAGTANTKALRLRANINSAAAAVQGITVSPTGLNLTGDYKIQALVWQNTIGPFPNGGTGSTEFFGMGSGYSGTQANWRGGAAVGGGAGTWFAASPEGGFSNSSGTVRDYSAFKGTGATAANFITDPLVYNASGGSAASTTAQDNANTYYASISAGLDVGAVNNGDLAAAQNQVATVANAQSGTLANGSPAFAWRTWTIERIGNSITWSIDNTPIATLTSTGTSPLTLNGGTSLTFFDATSGVTSDPLLNFALVADYTVTVPEPATGVLVGVGTAGMLLRRKRRRA
jgi:hypothetical protein